MKEKKVERKMRENDRKNPASSVPAHGPFNHFTKGGGGIICFPPENVLFTLGKKP